jgi:hypothetical protein
MKTSFRIDKAVILVIAGRGRTFLRPTKEVPIIMAYPAKHLWFSWSMAQAEKLPFPF